MTACKSLGHSAPPSSKTVVIAKAVSSGPQKAREFNNKKAVLPQGNRAMLQVFFSVEVRQQHSLQV